MVAPTPEQAIDRIRAVFGEHPGYRTLHAKGAFYDATFVATPEAAARCRALHLQSTEVPVLLRWSNGGGNPKASDKAQDVRGLAVSFKLPDGTATDLLGQTAPYFPVRTVESFLQLTEAATDPKRFPRFLAKHPKAAKPILRNGLARAIIPPYSYAEVAYYPIHAYKWIAPDGTSSWVRYTFRPLATASDRVDAKFGGRNRLHEEIAARLAKAPVHFALSVQVAGDGDDPHDPMSTWKSDLIFDAGTLTVTSPAADPEADGGLVVFDPTRVVDGIELSDDPILRYRAGAYSESVNRRWKG